MNAVKLGSDGTCTPLCVKRSRHGKWTMNGKKLYLHHHVSGIAMLSPVDMRQMQSPHIAIFEHPLPPPLDAHVYPDILIVTRYDADTEIVGILTEDDFVQLCMELVASSQCSDDIAAVYDVPAIPINYDEDEYASDDDDDNHLEVESDDDDEADIEDEDDEWDDDDDVQSTT